MGLNIENVANRPRCRKLAATIFRLWHEYAKLPSSTKFITWKKNWYSHNTKTLILIVWKQRCKNCPIQRRRAFRITPFLNSAHCPVVLYSATCSVWNTSRRSKSTNQANLSAVGLYLPQSPAFPKQCMYYQMAQLGTKI